MTFRQEMMILEERIARGYKRDQIGAQLGGITPQRVSQMVRVLKLKEVDPTACDELIRLVDEGLLSPSEVYKTLANIQEMSNKARTCIVDGLFSKAALVRLEAGRVGPGYRPKTLGVDHRRK